MNTPVIPAENTDLLSLVRKNDRRFLIKWSVTTALLLALAIAFFKPAAGLYGIPLAVLMVLGFLVLPFLLCGGIEWITDRGFTGIVEDMDFSVRIEMHDSIGVGTVKGTRKGKARHHSAGQTNYCKVTVSTSEGKTKAVTLRLPGDSEALPLKVGDRIVKYHGLPYPAIVGCKTPICPLCGRLDDDGKGECRTCGSSLIVIPLQ